MENKRRKNHTSLECVPTGYANGTASDKPLTQEEKDIMIQTAADAFGQFLDA